MLTAALEAILLSQLQSPLSHQGHPDPVIPRKWSESRSKLGMLSCLEVLFFPCSPVVQSSEN